MNTLPRYWIVEIDEKIAPVSAYRETVFKYLNEQYQTNWYGGYKYYGYDGSSSHQGSDCHDSITPFQNNPVVLTLKQFLSCTTKEVGCRRITPIMVNVPKI